MSGPREREQPSKALEDAKDDKRAESAVQPEPETTDEKTASNMKAFHKAFERRRR